MANVVSLRRMELIRRYYASIVPTVALVFALGVQAPVALASAIGIAAGLIVLVLALRYEHRRLTPQVLTAHGMGT